MRIPFTKKSIPLGPFVAFIAKFVPNIAVVPILQGPARGIRWQAGSGMMNFWLGTYEREKYEAFAQEIRPGMVVYDVGANVGAYTVLSARAIGPTGRVFAFEPDVQNLSRLARNVELNRFENCTIVPAAASLEDRYLWFETGKDSCIGKLSNEGKIPVSAVSLDSFIDMGNPAPDLIKMDIEGGEWDALRGSVELLSSRRPILFLTTHGDQIHRQCCSFLEKNEYVLDLLADDEVVARPKAGQPTENLDTYRGKSTR